MKLSTKLSSIIPLSWWTVDWVGASWRSRANLPDFISQRLSDKERFYVILCVDYNFWLEAGTRKNSFSDRKGSHTFVAGWCGWRHSTFSKLPFFCDLNFKILCFLEIPMQGSGVFNMRNWECLGKGIRKNSRQIAIFTKPTLPKFSIFRWIQWVSSLIWCFSISSCKPKRYLILSISLYKPRH